MDFLKTAMISDDTIKLIMENNSSVCLFNLECNKEECLRIIKFIRNIGIRRVDDLLIKETEIFIQSLREFMKKISRYDIVEVVTEVNDNPLMIEKYMNNIREA